MNAVDHITYFHYNVEDFLIFLKCLLAFQNTQKPWDSSTYNSLYVYLKNNSILENKNLVKI